MRMQYTFRLIYGLENTPRLSTSADNVILDPICTGKYFAGLREMRGKGSQLFSAGAGMNQLGKLFKQTDGQRLFRPLLI